MIEITCSHGGKNSKFDKDNQSMQEVQFVV